MDQKYKKIVEEIFCSYILLNFKQCLYAYMPNFQIYLYLLRTHFVSYIMMNDVIVNNINGKMSC